MSNIFFSETIRRMKLKLGIHDYDTSLFIRFALLCFVAMATKTFHRRLTEKVKFALFLSDWEYFDIFVIYVYCEILYV